MLQPRVSDLGATDIQFRDLPRPFDMFEAGVVVEMESEIPAEFVRQFQATYSAAREAMTEDFRFALRPDPGDKLLYFQWGDDGDIEGETHCDILLDGLGGHWHFQLAFASDSDGYGKARLAGKPYKLKPKAVVKAWPEILERLGGAADDGDTNVINDGGVAKRPCLARDTELFDIHELVKNSRTHWADTRNEWNHRNPNERFAPGAATRDIIRRAVEKVEKERSGGKKV